MQERDRGLLSCAETPHLQSNIQQVFSKNISRVGRVRTIQSHKKCSIPRSRSARRGRNGHNLSTPENVCPLNCRRAAIDH